MFGKENVILTLAREMQFSEFLPIVGVLRNSQAPHTELVEKANKNKISNVVFPCRGKLDIRTVLSIRKFIRDNNIKIIHSHDYKSNFYTLLVYLLTQVHSITTCHNWIIANKKLKLYFRFDLFLLDYFDHIVIVSTHLRNILLDRGIVPGKITTIYNGICVNGYHYKKEKSNRLRAELNIPAGSQIVGAVGRLSSEKGFHLLIMAAKEILREFPQTFFIFIGDGPERERLMGLSGSLGINCNVRFMGIRDDIEDIYPLMDIFVLPSFTEGLPISLLEAMASKRPVIATKVGSIPCVIDHGNEGFLVDPGNIEELIKSLTYLLSHKKLAEIMGERGYQKVISDFTSKSMAQKYFSVYRQILHSFS